MAFVEDLAPFLDLEGFAVEAEWLSPVVGIRTTIKGIFDNGYGSAFDGLVGAQHPTFLTDSESVADAAQEDTLTIGEVEYGITNIEPDGVGMTTLRLRKI